MFRWLILNLADPPFLVFSQEYVDSHFYGYTVSGSLSIKRKKEIKDLRLFPFLNNM